MNTATDPVKADPVLTMANFFTRQRANEGVELALTLPDGTATKHSIRIRGIDSDAFKEAEANQRRRVYEATAEQDKDKLGKVLTDIRLETQAALVISWTFEDPCTTENVKQLFRDAPQIGEEIDRLASRRALFFKLGSTNSTPSPAQSSS